MVLEGRKLIRLRAMKKWTQRQAARKAGVSESTYRKAEYGGKIQAALAGRIVEAFKADLETLEKVDEVA